MILIETSDERETEVCHGQVMDRYLTAKVEKKKSKGTFNREEGVRKWGPALTQTNIST